MLGAQERQCLLLALLTKQSTCSVEPTLINWEDKHKTMHFSHALRGWQIITRKESQGDRQEGSGASGLPKVVGKAQGGGGREEERR